MRRILFAAVIALLSVACTKDDATAMGGGNESLVSFSVSSPELQTRAYGDGTSATTLEWAFYVHEDGDVKLLEDLTGSITDFDGSYELKVSLVEGREYSALFWASDPDAANVYDVDWEKKEMYINYDADPNILKANQEAYDAFFKHYPVDKDKKTHEIELRRPFAQVNIATADYEAAADAGVTVKKTEVEIDAYTTLKLDAAEVKNSVADKTTLIFNAEDIATGTCTVSGKDFTMLAMNYVLVGDRELVDVKMTAYEEDGTSVERNYTTVPVQRNYRTYIVGNLLTTNNIFEVITDARWAEPAYEYGEIADGVFLTSEGEYIISNAEGMKWLANEVDNGADFAGKTVKLATDIDLYEEDANGEAICFEPIGSYRKDKAFMGTFDGQNNTISNLNQNTWALDNGYYYGDLGLGLFGLVEDATIKNLNMDNASISGESAICGVVAATAYGDCTFENITVKNSNCADYQYYAGGIVGWASGNHTYKKCNIDASTTIAAQWGDFDNSIGGVIGGAGGSAQILMEDCNVACRIDAYNDVTSTYRWYAYRRSGMLIGNTGKTKEIDGTTYADAPQLTCKNVTVTYGEWANYTYCEFAGKNWPYVRVQAGVSNSAYSNPRYGHPTDANGNEVVDDNHVHNAGEDHHISCLFDQLYGGGQGVYGTRTHDGVTLVYPWTDNQVAVSSYAELKAALEDGKDIYLLTNIINNDAAVETIVVDEDFSLESNGFAIANEAGAVFAIAENAAVTITIEDDAKFTGSTDGITVPASATLTLTGEGNLTVEGEAGSGIGAKGANAGAINIDGLAHITAKGNGDHAFGIGGNGAAVLVKNSTVDYACGGHVQPNFINDTKYGKSEPEGGAAIGGATIKIEGSTITKVDGGSKAAGIGAQYWQSTAIEIINSTIVEANGGNASAGIGGSRYAGDGKYNLSIKITGSNVTATGGEYGSGIGSGYDTHCNGQSYTATNNIEIDATSTINAKGGKYAAGIGTGYHSAYLSGSIATGATVTAVSGEKFYKDTYSQAQDIGYGVIDPAREFSGANTNVSFTVNGEVIPYPYGEPAVKLNNSYYATLEAAAGVAKAGDTITLATDVTLAADLGLPAGITLNGNGKQINGNIYAKGNLTFEGHTKVASFSASYYDRIITIGEGACLEITGTGRTTLAYGNTFNITGSITNAKSADKANIQPSLIIPGGISITGGNDATMNIKNAYVQIGSTTSKNSAANGTFTLNIENSIAEFTNQFTLAEPTSGKNPTFNMNVKNSVLTTGTKLIIAAPNSNVVFDNSTVDIKTYFRNSGTVTLKNGSSLTGSTIQFGENGGNDGTTNVDASTLTIDATSTGHALDGKDTGSINLRNGATASVTYYKDMTITTDATSTFNGTEVQ